MVKNCLILSNGPVPTPEHEKVEGGGLRCWGLAKGLIASNPGLEITVAYHESYKQEKFTKKHEKISITTWKLETTPELIKKYDTVIVSYCMGDLSVVVADTLRSDQQLVLDCYVPIYVEASARDTSDLEREYAAFHADVGRWGHVLRRGDLFLCASQQQKNYYKGVLSALGRVNPATYGEDPILVVPYGIYRDEPKSTTKPISDLVRNKSVKKILWFGGIYPWFDLRGLVDAVKIVNKSVPTKLIIVGAKNPFNNHPDFVSKYDQLVRHIADAEVEDLVVLQDWVRFEDRADWYLDSDIVVVINKLGQENELAWRTRLVDFMWANLPVITNGGDPLGETLISAGAAIKLSGLSAEIMAKDLQKTLGDEEKLSTAKKQLVKLKPSYYWDSVTASLAKKIAEHYQSKDRKIFGEVEIKTDQAASRSTIRKVYSKARMLPAYAHKYGWRNTYFAVRTIAVNRLHRASPYASTKPKVIFIAHQLDISGAPFVFVGVLNYLKSHHPKLPLDFYTFNPAHHSNISKLNKIGVKPKVFLSRDVGFDFNRGDVVVLNTVAHTQVLKNSIFTALENDTLNHLVWYIHEDEPALIFNPTETIRIKKLLARKKITIFMAGSQTRDSYRRFFSNDKQIRLQPYRITVPKKHHKVRKADDFDKLRFVLPGSVGDGRKGHLPIMYALMAFKDNYYDKSPEAYRDFSLEFIGLGEDFLSRQIINHAGNGLGSHFHHNGKISHEAYLEIVNKSNVTICYSLREALPLFVFEGMYNGHPILRNDSSGMAEQLFKGKNGFYLDSMDYNQVVETLEKILNKQKTTNQQLAAMSRYSYDVASKQAHNDYSGICDEIYQAFTKAL